MKPAILAAAKQHVLLFDGGIGTQLQALGLPIGSSPDIWNQRHPEHVASVHQAYKTAGAQILTTNSFGASPFKLKAEGLEDEAEQINLLAARIAYDIMANQGWIAGSIGPTGALLVMGDITEDEMYDGFSLQAKALASGGADLILIETMSDLTEARLAIRAARSACDLPVFVSFTFSPGLRGYRTLMGVDIPQAAEALRAEGITVFGCNCGTGADDAIRIVEEMARNWDGLILCEPNAGLPELVDGKTVYRETPEIMAAKLPVLVKSGANFVGGCCGTSPAHTKAFQQELARSR